MRVSLRTMLLGVAVVAALVAIPTLMYDLHENETRMKIRVFHVNDQRHPQPHVSCDVYLDDQRLGSSPISLTRQELRKFRFKYPTDNEWSLTRSWGYSYWFYNAENPNDDRRMLTLRTSDATGNFDDDLRHGKILTLLNVGGIFGDNLSNDDIGKLISIEHMGRSYGNYLNSPLCVKVQDNGTSALISLLSIDKLPIDPSEPCTIAVSFERLSDGKHCWAKISVANYQAAVGQTIDLRNMPSEHGVFTVSIWSTRTGFDFKELDRILLSFPRGDFADKSNATKD